MIHIKKADSGEWPQVIEWVEKLLRELEDDSAEFAGLESDKIMQDLQRNASCFTAFFASNADADIIGVMTVVETFAIYAGGNYGVIDEMYVAPGYRSQGVGQKLLEAAKALGREKGWLRLDVTAPPGEPWQRTVRFYENNGFVFTGPKLRLML